MSAHEAFNRSSLSRFVNSAAGRVFRVVAGTGFLAAGIAWRGSPLGLVSLGWSVFPLSAGIFDVCWISAALGGPFSGSRIRALQRHELGRPAAAATNR